MKAPAVVDIALVSGVVLSGVPESALAERYAPNGGSNSAFSRAAVREIGYRLLKDM